MHGSRAWRLCIDTGGTFTDCLGIDPAGVTHRAKVLSTGVIRAKILRVISPTCLELLTPLPLPDAFLVGAVMQRGADPHGTAQVRRFDSATGRVEHDGGAGFTPGLVELDSEVEAPVLAAHLVTGTPLDQPLPPIQLRLATTRGTNALLERSGRPTALVVTRGFADLLRIGTQQRPDLFALDIEKPAPLHENVIEVAEAVDANGAVLAPPDESRLRHDAERLVRSGVRCAAIAFKNAYVNDAHERCVESILREAGFTHVTRSTALAPLIRLLPRAETALVNTYLAPIVGGYLDSVGRHIPTSATTVMTSAGGLIGATGYRPCDSLLSGPAGGVAGAAAVARIVGESRVLSFDMGGTSTDVARWAGDFEYTFEHQVGDARLLAPALAIQSVAAGGGSICWFDGHRLRVGPQSAGASPGPACYGLGGPLTVTDVNLLLGRLDVTRFQTPLDQLAAERRCDGLLAQVRETANDPVARDQLLADLLAIANSHMADAISRISLRRGFDPGEHALVAFGGAGGQHACAIADLLGINRIIAPADAGLLSAVGLNGARIERFAHRQVLRALAAMQPGELKAIVAELESHAVRMVRDDAPGESDIVVRRRMVEVRVLGQDSTLTIEFQDEAGIERQFRSEYQRLFGIEPPGRLEVEAIRVIACTQGDHDPSPGAALNALTAPAATPPRHIEMTVGGVRAPVAVFDRETMRNTSAAPGPALLVDQHSTTLVEAGWTYRSSDAGHVIIERCTVGERSDEQAVADRSEAARLELFTNRFRAVVEDMGELLRRMAQSTNVKERLDFSCALLDSEARLVANAPHIPVHLGAMGCCVRAVREALELKPGDVVVTNHPGFGGSHLPDITLITPVFDGDALLGYVANRAHHAELGGARPGSMPPDATTLAAEGVVIPPMYVARQDRIDWSPVRTLLSGPPHPSRLVEVNLADLSAALAANRHGAAALRGLVASHGRATMAHYMRALRQHAADAMRRALTALGDQTGRAVEHLDDGTTLAVTVHTRDGHATIDFSGCSPVHHGNLNATPAIVHSAVMYVLRLLVRESLPLNEGLLEPVEIILPPHCLLNPPFGDRADRCPAVVGGNTETSQRLVDTLIKALGLAACSQGTMNNVLFGSASFGYYETICGGSGATAQRAGADAVHTHMTNTRITDAEVLEHRYPVRVHRFAIRRGSGGAGAHRGGDGVVREIEFLAPASLSVLTQHRIQSPFGAAGGAAGCTGRQFVRRSNGEFHHLSSIDGCEVRPGDRFIIETPGGGGWGVSATRATE